MRSRLNVLAAVIAVGSIVAFSPGCQAVGSRLTTTGTGADVRTGTPNTLTMTDADGQWTANTTGPAGWTAINADGIERFHEGSTPRELYYDRASGRLVLSSGTDIRATGVVVDPTVGTISIGEFATSASEPIRAGNEAYDRLVTFWQSLTEAQRAAHVADVEAWKAAGDTFAPVLLEALKAIATGSP